MSKSSVDVDDASTSCSEAAVLAAPDRLDLVLAADWGVVRLEQPLCMDAGVFMFNY